MKRVLVAVAAVLAFASPAVALPVDWSGSWDVDGRDRGPFIEERLPGELVTVALLPIEGEDRRVELSGRATERGLELDTVWLDGIGITGFFESVKTKTKHQASLRATVRSRGAEVVADAVWSVDGREVRRETWRCRSDVELVRLEQGKKPLAGDVDLKRGGPLVARVRVSRSATPVTLRVEIMKDHPYGCYYSSATVATRRATLEPGEHELVWDGRDDTAAKRLALGGSYRLVVEPSWPRAQARAANDGLPPPAQVRALASRREACFRVQAPRLEMMCSDWPENYGDVKRPRWNEGPELARAGATLARAPDGRPGLLYEGPRVLTDALVAAKLLKESAFALTETHGGVDSIWFFNGDPTKPWKRGAQRDDGITGRYFDRGDLKDLHFAVLLNCKNAMKDEKGDSFASHLRDAGADVVIAFASSVGVGESRRARDLFLRFVSEGAPVEKAARDAARVSYRNDHPQPEHFLFFETGKRPLTDAELNAAIEAERRAPIDDKVNYGMKSLAAAMVVERGKGIRADESMWPPRWGNATN